MSRHGVARAALVALLGVGGTVLACTAGDPLIGLDPAAGEDAGTDAGGAGTDGGGGTDAGTDGGTRASSCPAVGNTIPCTASNAVYDGATFRIDACANPLPDGYVTSFPSILGPPLVGAPGASFCNAALAGRPALVFDHDGFFLSAAEAKVFDTGSRAFTLFAVLQYTPTSRAESLAGGIVFQRAGSDYPFAGPRLVANFAWQSSEADDTTLAPSQRFGGSMQFGVDSGGSPKTAVASVSTNVEPKPFLAVFRLKVNGELTLDLNRVAMPSAFVSATFNAFGLNLPAYFGYVPGSTKNFFAGSLSELVYFPNYLPDTERLMLTDALIAKWGLTP